MDVDIYENVTKITPCQIASEMWFFFFSVYSYVQLRLGSRFAICFREIKIIAIEPFYLERFAWHFHTYPHPMQVLIPNFEILCLYLIVHNLSLYFLKLWVERPCRVCVLSFNYFSAYNVPAVVHGLAVDFSYWNYLKLEDLIQL